jgi:hypothetical protein
MDDDLVRSIVLWLWSGIGLGVTIGPLCGLLAGWLGLKKEAAGVGFGVFCVCLTVGAGTAGGIAAQAALERREGMVPALGELRGFETQSRWDAGKRRTERMQVPRVVFTTAEGRTLEFDGLGGSLARNEPGDVVRVRYRPEKPEQAIVDDFQHQWGAAWAMGAFAGFGLAGSLAFIGGAVGGWRRQRQQAQLAQRGAGRNGRPGAPPEPTPTPGAFERWRRAHGPRLGRQIGWLALASFLLALFSVGFFSNSVARSVAIAFAGVCSALLLGAVARWLASGPGNLGMTWGLVGMAAAFGYFGFGAWMLSAP